MASVVLIVTFATLQLATSSFYPDMSSESQCQCVPPDQCADSDGSSNGHGLLDIRFEDDACPNYYEVCCDEPIKKNDIPSKPPAAKKCGLSNTAGILPRITSNSEITQFGELPWTVLILQKNQKPDRFICGGSLIHPQVVLTAAHCVAAADLAHIKVRAGEWNIRTIDEPLPHQDATVREVLVHGQYKPGILWNDVALLFLAAPFAPNDNVGFACLPARPRAAEEAVQGCVASGWGRNSFGKGRHAALLRKVTLPIIGRGRCQVALRNTRLGKFYKLHRSFLCAGGEKGRDACKGDGGSPLVCPIGGESGRFVQMGIVSWGIGCGADKTPGVYVNVGLFIDWIDKQVLAKNFTTDYYKI